jgi:quercetin dioxygenase-like cupin family protein
MEKKRWSDIETAAINDNISLQTIYGDKIMLSRWQLAPNTVLPLHEHEAEQLTTVESGAVTLSFGDGEQVTLVTGDMLLIPSFVAHGVQIGPDGATAFDVFSPIRQDLIDKKPVHSMGTVPGTAQDEGPRTDDQIYAKLNAHLIAAGIRAPLEKIMELPVELLAKYVYEKECVTMGQLREILGLDKQQAKALLRKWKHGDDHSEASLKRKLERLVIMPWELAEHGKK